MYNGFLRSGLKKGPLLQPAAAAAADDDDDGFSKMYPCLATES